MGVEPRFVLIADTFDPLRKVPKGLDPSYEEHIGKPISRIPSPDGEGSYADHFLNRFVDSLRGAGIEPEVLRADALYAEGAYTETITDALQGADGIREILTRLSGRELPSHWAPANPVCSECGRMNRTRVAESDTGRTRVRYTCPCGHEGWADYSRGEVKLPWRIDWPARWRNLGVSFEPFGKDHASTGGSYATAVPICKEVFGYTPPVPLPYEFVLVRGGEKLSSSAGRTITLAELLEVAPPPVIRYMLARYPPARHMTIDTAGGLLQIIEQYEELQRDYLNGKELSAQDKRTYELSTIEGVSPDRPLSVSFRHLVALTQIAEGDPDRLEKILSRGIYRNDLEHRDCVHALARHAWNWARTYAPKEFRFEVQPELPREARDLPHAQREALGELAGQIEGIDESEESQLAERIHQCVYEAAERTGLKGADVFRALYTALLGLPSGPRAGWFLTQLDRDWTISRLREAAPDGTDG